MEESPLISRSPYLAVTILLLGAAPAFATPVTLQSPTATYSQTGFGGFSVASSIDGDPNGTGWAIDPNEVNQTAVFEASADVFTVGGGTLTFTLTQNFGGQHTIGKFRLSATTDDRSTFADGLASGGDVTANWTVLDPATYSATNGAILTELGDLSLLANGPNPLTSVYTVSAVTTLAGITGFRLEVLEDPSLVTGGPNGSGPGRQPTNGNFVLTNFGVDAVAAAVPEPATLALFGAGLLGLGALRRRKAKA